MSPDRITMTRAEAIRRRKEEEQNRRGKLTLKKVVAPKPAPAPKPASKTRAGKGSTGINRTGKPAVFNRWSRRYDISMSSPTRRPQVAPKPKTPSISITMPHIAYGPRWISFFMAIFCVVDMYLMLNNDAFIVQNAEISGNKQITSQEIQNVLRIANWPAAYLNPDQIQANILGAFPDISSAHVNINLPNNVVISVEERTPVAAWRQDGQTVWVDALGYAFPPRGQIENLPVITALGAPPAPYIDPKQTIGARPFLRTEFSQAIVTISSNLPQGATLIFDPQYGLGWKDPQGWKVYFGNSDGDNALKIQVYQNLLDYLKKKNLKPTLISVEYPNAPFYQLEQ